VREEVDGEADRAEGYRHESRETECPARRDEEQREPRAADDAAGAGELGRQGPASTTTTALAWWSPTRTVSRYRPGCFGARSTR